jgi:hypothetical protein
MEIDHSVPPARSSGESGDIYHHNTIDAAPDCAWPNILAFNPAKRYQYVACNGHGKLDTEIPRSSEYKGDL